MKPFVDAAVEAVFDASPAQVRKRLLALRRIIFEVAVSTEGVGELEETLKWGRAGLPDQSLKKRQHNQDRRQARQFHAVRAVCELPDHFGRYVQNPVSGGVQLRRQSRHRV